MKIFFIGIGVVVAVVVIIFIRFYKNKNFSSAKSEIKDCVTYSEILSLVDNSQIKDTLNIHSDWRLVVIKNEKKGYETTFEIKIQYYDRNLKHFVPLRPKIYFIAKTLDEELLEKFGSADLLFIEK